MSSLLQLQPDSVTHSSEPFIEEQREDARIAEIIEFLEGGKLPYVEDRAQTIVLQQSLFAVVDQILYFTDSKRKNSKIVVPAHLQEQLLVATHRSVLGGHFSGKHLYNTLSSHWWWSSMYVDCV